MASTVPGGRYRRPNGVLVDAHGNVLEEAPAPSRTPTTQPPDDTSGDGQAPAKSKGGRKSKRK